MKKILLAALAAIAVTLGVTDAKAGGVMRHQELAWRFINAGTVPNATQHTKALAAGGTDTTIWVGTDGWYIPDSPAADSVVVARFIVYLDSTAAYSPAQTTLTAVVDAAVSPVAGTAIAGSSLSNPNALAISQTLTPTTGEKVMFINVVLGKSHVGTNNGMNGWCQLAPFIRLRLATSAAINAAAVAIQYLAPSISGN